MAPAEDADRGDAASVNGMLVEFGQWLARQRGLAPVTVHNYRWNARQFLETLPPPVEVSVGRPWRRSRMTSAASASSG